MKKVLAIVSDNNKCRFITKGFAGAFKKLSFFVYEKKVCDLNTDEINIISPDIVFIFWTASSDNEQIEKFIDEYIDKYIFIHCAEYIENIPCKFWDLKNHYIHTRLQAVSADDYKSEFNGFKYRISFAGSPSYPQREEVLAAVVRNFGIINIFCRSFDFYKSLDDITDRKLLDDFEIELYKKSYKGYLKKQNELAAVYSSSIINLDIISRNPKDINYRVLEITAAEGFTMAPYSKRLAAQYEEGKDIEIYRNTDELIDKIGFYLQHPEIASVIAAGGRKNTVNNFSYYDKLKAVLRVIYGQDFNSR